MKRSFVFAIALSCMASLGVIGSTGCGSPLVGLECKSGYTRCGDQCVDLRADENHCGGCNMQCGAGESCVANSCTSDLDGSLDGGLDRDGGEGGADGDAGEGGTHPDAGDQDGGDEGGLEEGGWPDVELPPRCMGPGSAPNCVCDIGELICDQECVDANNDLANCGGCDMACPTVPEPDQYYCVSGACVLNCVDRKDCGGRCVDVESDPRNCGDCNVVCESGICENSTCLDATAAHVIVVGHDLSSSLPAMRRLAGNAMFLPSRQTVRGLVYRQYSSVAAAAGVQSTIAEMQSITGRTFRIPPAADNPPAEAVPFWLSQVDVLVVASQSNASRADLLRVGTLWSRALTQFMQRGGVVVLFESGGANRGTFQVLEEAGLFRANGVSSLEPGTVYLSATNDVVTTLVPRRYNVQMNQAVTFDTTEEVVVVRDDVGNRPVVIHISR